MTDIETEIIHIVSAKHEGDYRLRLFFNNGQERVVDFAPFLRRSLNPLIRKYLDSELFKQFTVENGDLFWHDYDLCFPVIDLYEGNL